MSDELVTVTTRQIGVSNVPTVIAREVHAFLEVQTAFKDWIARRITEYEFKEGQDFCSFLSESSGSRPAKEYALSLGMAKELAMVERTEKGKLARRYFIDCERRVKLVEANLIPRTLAEALRLAANLAEALDKAAPQTRAHRVEERPVEAQPATNAAPSDGVIDEWIAFDDAYGAFVKAHPMLGLGDNAWASINLRRNYGARLLACGAVRQLPNRRWLAHREHFGPKLFELLTRGPAEIIERVRSRCVDGAS